MRTKFIGRHQIFTTVFTPLPKPPANPIQRVPVDLCPNGFSECCYNSREFARSIGGECVPVGQKCSEGSGVGNRASGLLAGTIGELRSFLYKTEK